LPLTKAINCHCQAQNDTSGAGINNITADDEKQISKLLAENPEEETIEHDLLLAPVWMRNIIRRNIKSKAL
jgi:hypothetical protein